MDNKNNTLLEIINKIHSSKVLTDQELNYIHTISSLLQSAKIAPKIIESGIKALTKLKTALEKEEIAFNENQISYINSLLEIAEHKIEARSQSKQTTHTPAVQQQAPTLTLEQKPAYLSTALKQPLGRKISPNEGRGLPQPPIKKSIVTTSSERSGQQIN